MRTALLQTAIGDYRQNVLDLLGQRLGDTFRIFSGAAYFDPTIQTRVSLENLTIINNNFLLRRKLSFQTGMWLEVLNADVVIFELNPRILSNWLLLLLRSLQGKKSVLWGHAWPRGGRHKKSDHVRGLMRYMADTIIVYTETQAKELRQKMPYKRIVAAPNSLYYKKTMYASSDVEKVRDFIYVGRLIPEKKPALLLEAFASASAHLPNDTYLVFVGDGPLRNELEARSRELGLEARVLFKGHVIDLEQLRELYSTSITSVVPGTVGLSITQSFAFGVPMIIAREEPHGPEIEAAREGMNSLMFQSDSRDDLARTLLDFSENRRVWIARRAAIAEECAERYSVEFMVSRMLEAISVND